MNKILVVIKKNTMYFSIYNNDINDSNLNNTNVIDVKNLKFSEQYILKNLDVVSTFLNLIVLKSNVNNVVVKNVDIGLTVLKIIDYIPSIKGISFNEDKTLSYSMCSLLLENRYLETISCYNLPEIMFYRFKNVKVNTRFEILFISDLMIDNKIRTYSDIFSVTKLVINKELNSDDYEDLEYLFTVNKVLRQIDFFLYNFKDIMRIEDLIYKYRVKCNIIIHENSNNTNSILSDIDDLSAINKNKNIKIKYSKKYLKQNLFKQLNIVMIKYALIVLIVCSLIFLGVSKLKGHISNKNTEKNLSSINNVVNEVIEEVKIDIVDFESEEQVNEDNQDISNEEEVKEEEKPTKPVYVSPYYSTYEKIYNKLININPDTVGWLTVKNTNIDYPIVQTTNNVYYLENSYDKTGNLAGWLFVDYRNKLDGSDKNIIIYGHNVRNTNHMFSTLKNVLDESWYTNNDNLNITFNIKDESITWTVFSIYTIEETNSYLRTNFNDDDHYLKFVDELKEKSIYDFGVTVNANEEILTLSSCYLDSSHRLVLHAVRKK